MTFTAKIITIISFTFLGVLEATAQPVWVRSTPSVLSTGTLSINLNYGIDRTGNVYVIVFGYNNTASLTSSYVRLMALAGPLGQIVATAVLQVKKGDVNKILETILNVQNSDQIYTIYVVAADGKGLLQSIPVRLNARTLPCPDVNPGTGGDVCGLSFKFSAVPVLERGTWTKISGPGKVTFSPNNRTPDAVVTVSEYGSYVFRWTETSVGCTKSADITVSFFEMLGANAGPGGDECDLDFQLNAVPGGVQGTWSKVGGPGNATFTPDIHHPDAVVSVSLPGSYDFAWTEESLNCSSTDIIRVVFHEVPPVSAGQDATICYGSSVSLQVEGSGTFVWQPAEYLNDPFIPNPVATPLQTTVFSVLLSDEWGCINSDQVTIVVREKPVAYAGEDHILEFVFSTILDADEPAEGAFGEWSVIKGSGSFDNKNDSKTRVNELSKGENSLKWTVTNNVCPSSSDTVNIFVKDLVIPTMITPNMDGKNDLFYIGGLETLEKTALTVFNRWGAIVFEDKNYANTWTGDDLYGEPLPEDTYFYILKPATSGQIKGYIVIRR